MTGNLPGRHAHGLRKNFAVHVGTWTGMRSSATMHVSCGPPPPHPWRGGQTLPDDVRQRCPSRLAKDRRDADWSVHVYFTINDKILWDAVSNKVPELLRTLQAFKDERPGSKPASGAGSPPSTARSPGRICSLPTTPSTSPRPSRGWRHRTRSWITDGPLVSLEVWYQAPETGSPALSMRMAPLRSRTARIPWKKRTAESGRKARCRRN